MDCSLGFGAPEILHLVAGSNQPVLPRSRRKCPRCNSTNVNTNKELLIEINDVTARYLKEKYPYFTFGLEARNR